MLAIHDLSIFQAQNKVFSDLSLNFQSGEFWAIIGANGVGKSTLLQAMSGLSNNYQGEIKLDGRNLETLDPTSRAQSIGFLLQEQEASLAFTVKEAVAMGRYPWRHQDMADAQLTQEALELCQINHLQHRSILNLSGGERRKVEIATCLAQQTQYLLLDEPLNHLDLVYRNHVLKVFQNISKEKCVVMVCHDLSAVRNHCSHVLLLFSNNCYLSGTSATILTEENLQRLFNEPSQLHQE